MPCPPDRAPRGTGRASWLFLCLSIRRGPPVPGVRAAHGTVGSSGLQVPKTPHGLVEPLAPPGSEQAPREAGGEARGPMFRCPHV